MCGIMGYYSFGSKRPKKDSIANMFELLETRGKDSSGFAFINGNNLIVNKSAIKSSEMVKTDDWTKLILPKIMILHTRQYTQGSPVNNANNHPLFNKQGICIVHNGIIHNDKEIFGKKERDGEVDSEAILAVLSSKTKGDKIKRVFDRLEGSFAFAAIDKNNPDSLILVKKDNPLNLYFNPVDDILYFCSESEIMQEALMIKKTTMRGFNIGEGDYHSYEMENNHALVLNKDGVESYKQYYTYKPNYHYRDYNFASEYKSSANQESLLECPWCLETTSFYKGRLFNKCEHCGMSLSEDDFYYM